VTRVELRDFFTLSGRRAQCESVDSATAKATATAKVSGGVRLALLAAALAAVFVPVAVQAQAVGPVGGPAVGPVGGGGLRVTPSLDFGLSYVDSNYAAAAPAGIGSRGDVVTSVRPGVQMALRRGRTVGSLSYTLDATHHSRAVQGFGQGNTVQNNLDAKLSTELLERWVYFDASARVSQQAISAFGQQSFDGQQNNANRTEVSQLSVRPYARGPLAGVATYEVALNADTTQSKSGAAADSRAAGANLSVSSAASGSVFGWSTQLSKQRASFSGGNRSDSTRGIVSLLIRPDPDWSGTLRAGQEATKVGAFYNETYNNWGGDIRWTPSPRTSVLLSADDRYFGRAHQVSFEHRLARSSIRYTSSRDASNSAGVGAGLGTGGGGQQISLYQLFYNQFASVQPDPVLRDQLVREFLATIGQNPNAVVAGGFSSGGTTLQRRDELALSYAGLRTTLTLQAFSSQTTRLDLSAGAVNNFKVKQSGYTSALTYRLSPLSNLSLTASHLNTQGSGTQAGNQLDSVSLGWSGRLGKMTTTSVNARYSVFEGPINPYKESSLGATLGLRF